MEEQPDFEAAYSVDVRVIEQVHIKSRHFVAFAMPSVHHLMWCFHLFCSQVLSSFISTIGLEKEYSLVVINPRPPAPGVTYGYRYGFSKSELRHLRSSASAVAELLSRPTSDPYSSSLKSARGAPDVSKVTGISERSEAWSRRFFSSMYGSDSIDVQDALHSAIPEKLEEWFSWHRVHAGSGNGADTFVRLATNMLRSALPVDRDYIRSHVIEAAGSAGCLTEAWVSAHRFAWIDLSAGPFTWGTGAGAKGLDSLPHVSHDFFSQITTRNHEEEEFVSIALLCPRCIFRCDDLLYQVKAQLLQEEQIIQIVSDNRCGTNERVRH
jgi:hypothetical protein